MADPIGKQLKPCPHCAREPARLLANLYRERAALRALLPHGGDFISGRIAGIDEAIRIVRYRMKRAKERRCG